MEDEKLKTRLKHFLIMDKQWKGHKLLANGREDFTIFVLNKRLERKGQREKGKGRPPPGGGEENGGPLGQGEGKLLPPDGGGGRSPRADVNAGPPGGGKDGRTAIKRRGGTVARRRRPRIHTMDSGGGRRSFSTIQVSFPVFRGEHPSLQTKE